MKIPDKIVLCISSAYILFHTLILLGILPQNIVWGGQALAPATILLLESFAILVMLFLSFLILMKNKWIKYKWQDKTLNRWLMGFSIYFMLNTMANLLAETTFERSQAVFTIILAVSLFKISKQKL